MNRISTWLSRTRAKADAVRSAAARTSSTRAVSVTVLVGTVALLLYRLLVPFAAPQLAHLVFGRLAPGAGGWTAQARRIEFEPFTLAFDFNDVQVSGLDGEVRLSARSVRVNFSFRSVLENRAVLDALTIRGGVVRAATRAEPELWPQLRQIVAAARIAALDAEMTELAVATPAGGRFAHGLFLRGTDLDFTAARGSFAAEAGGLIGDESRLQASLILEPADAGARLHGTATLTRGRVAIGAWAYTAASADITVDSLLSASGIDGSLALQDGEIVLSDAGSPSARLALARAAADVSWRSATGAAVVRARASFADGGRANLELYRDAPGVVRSNARLLEVPATSVAAYGARVFGVPAASGLVDVEMSGGVDSAAPRVARVTTRGLELVAPEPSMQRAIAVLERPDGEISIEVPLDPARGLAEQLIEGLRARVTAAGDTPYVTLAALVGSDAARMSTIEFVPGTSDPSAEGHASIAALAAALRLRPRLGVEIEANTNAPVDRAALARGQVALHVTLATAQAAPASEERGPRVAEIDLASPRVQDVLDEFMRERLDAETLARLAASFQYPADAPPSSPQRVAHYRAAFAALVEREPISDAALGRLARFRTGVVAAQLTADGIAATRVVRLRDGAALAEGSGLVALPLALEPAPLAPDSPP